MSKSEKILTAMAIPFIIFIAVISYIPLLGWALAFFRYTPGIPLLSQDFAGLYNFKRIFTMGSGFGTAIRNTLVLSGLSILCSPLPIVFALLVNEIKSRKFSRLVQSATSLPYFISWVLVYAVFFLMFSVDDGLVNVLFYQKLGILANPINLLADGKNAWLVQTGIGIWKGLGYSGIIYLAALTGIDPELYNAADIDGAGRFRKMIHISLPGLSETYLVLLLLGIAGMLSGFEQYFVFQNPMTHQKLEVLDTYIYKRSMTDLQFDFSTAVGILKTIVSVTLLFSANFISKVIRGKNII